MLALAAGVLAIGLSLLDVDSVANVAKLACYALFGFWFLTLFEELWWITLVAVLVPWVDIWSVAAGPTEYVVEERPGIFESVAIAFPSPGETATVNLGPPDVVFFALFLAAADRFRLRVGCDLDRDDGLPRRHARARLVVGERRRAPCASGRLPRFPPAERRPALARREERARTPIAVGARYISPLHAAEGRNRLDVRRVREHVDGTAALELVAVLVA